MKYIPFSNGTEALDWQSYNCDPCKRRPCKARQALRHCHNMTKHAAEMCGGTPRIQDNGYGFADLPARCAAFTTISKRRDPGKNTPWLLDGGESF